MTKTETVFTTCVFKLHFPGRRKQAVLDYVFEQYTLKMIDLLSECETNIELLGDWGRVVDKNKRLTDKYSENSVVSVLPNSGDILLDIASPLKESLLNNVGSMIASYFELQKTDQSPGFPAARDPSPEGWPNALEDFALVGGDLNDENESRRRLLNRAKGAVMPIHYSRSRDFRILYDRKKERFFVWLKLLPAGHSLGQKTVIDQGNLIDVNTGEIFKNRSDTVILFPLEVGRRNEDWHWQYHNFIAPLAKQGKAAIKSAKLVRQESDGKSEYFLHVSFAFECPQPYEPESYLGIDRGVFFSMAYGIVDSVGGIIEMNHEPDGFRHNRIAAGKRVQARQKQGKPVTVRDYRQRHLDSILHALINTIIEKALLHKSMIVLEDLNIQIRGKFYKSAWKKMHKILAYKCKLAGVPVWDGGVWAAYTSQLCIYCGEINQWRKRDGSPFECQNHECGAVYHSDEGAGVNIARRALYKKEEWGGTKKRAGDWKAFHRSFANLPRFRAKMSLRNQEVLVT